ncbi:alpha-hydroxy acid oxidase [Modestobacter marinus]|uniref:Alpha-hydroxy-acid oxidizing enzyme n=1 Tax=Modestobacter marinus TaxID=477641 RepID=A0A846M2V3_9ACTN|nr:alpha-hydroxy acid oxidase [Modestobacter marinus]NIH68850.1 L-lactate dehydrogenase (cytochrome) [Modestobacter marinus]GGL60525.1 alpha-hydroxy-acid oxidizing enzyme [Modestobacter marinus]
MSPAEMVALLRVRRPELDGDRRRLARCHTVADLRTTARRRLPRAVFDYVDGAAEDEVTMRRNRAAFDEWELVPSVLRDVGEVELGTEVLGARTALPMVLGPTGFTRMVHPDGELAVARAAAARGIPYTAATMGTTSLEDVAAEVAAAAGGPTQWFQLYVWRDRGLCKELISRAREAGYRALVLTVDTPVPGARERDLRNGLTIPPELGLRTLADGARRPHWWWGLLRSEAVTFANVQHVAGGPQAVMEFVGRQFDPTVTWDDIAWMVEAWGGPFVVKGVLTAADARRAAAAGVDAVVVSNHGGRQLDHVGATLTALTEVVDAVGADLEVLVDSGFRRGTDIATALALGARAVLLGRPQLYGLAVGGQAGVERAVDLLAAELRRALQLLGVTDVAQLDRSVLRHR